MAGQRARGGRKGGETYKGLGSQSKLDLVLPRAAQPHQNILVRNVLDFCLVVVLGVVSKNDAFHLVGRPPQPALLEIVEDSLELGLRTGDVGHVAHAHAEGAAEETAEMRGRVFELVGLIVPLLKRDKDAQVVLAGAHFDGRARELGTNLVEASCVNLLLGALDPKGTDGRVVRGLLGQVGDSHRGVGVLGRLRDGDGRGGSRVAGAEAGFQRALS